MGLRLPAMVPVLVPGFGLCPEAKVSILVSGAGGSVMEKSSRPSSPAIGVCPPPPSRIGFLQSAGVLESSGDATGAGDVLPGNCLIKLASVSDLGVRLVSASTWLLAAGCPEGGTCEESRAWSGVLIISSSMEDLGIGLGLLISWVIIFRSLGVLFSRFECSKSKLTVRKPLIVLLKFYQN